MTRLIPCMLAAAFLSISSGSALAELQLPKPSSKVESTYRVGLTDVTLSYSSPRLKGRAIWGELVPFDSVWRTGANQCSKVSFSRETTFAGQALEKGDYCLFTIPGKDTWTVVLNSETSLWGANDYDEKKNVATTKVVPSTVATKENLEIAVENVSNAKADLVIAWGNLRVAVPLVVETEKHVLANIEELGEKATANELSSAAQYFLENSEDLTHAVSLIERSSEKKKTWRNQWVLAKILKKKGEMGKASEAAKKSLELGDGSRVFNFYKPQIEKATSWGM